MFKNKIETKNEILKRMKLTDKKFLLIDNSEDLVTILDPLWTYLKVFFETLYTSPSFISKLISLSDKEDVKNHLAPFFTNNFYENILSSQGIENNLIYIIYTLLKEEINSLNDINDFNKFLEKTPCGYILEELIEKIDIKSFCKLNILKVVKDLEWTFSGKQICFDIEKITESIKKSKELLKANSISFTNHSKKGENIIKKSYSVFYGNDNLIDNNNSIGKNKSANNFDGFEEKGNNKHNKNTEDSLIFNSKYVLNINPKSIDYKKYDKYDADNIKE